MKNEKLKIKEIIVVEGKDDTKRLQSVVEAETIETKGSAINKETLEQIKHAQAVRGIIVFTDPDYPGEKIRKTIINAVPEAKQAFLSRAEAKKTNKKVVSLGVEHASDEAIINALKQVYTPKNNAEIIEAFSTSELYKLGLTAGPKAKERRKKIGERLRIGETNGKQLQKRLQMFGITKEQLLATLQDILEEEKNAES